MFAQISIRSLLRVCGVAVVISSIVGVFDALAILFNYSFASLCAYDLINLFASVVSWCVV